LLRVSASGGEPIAVTREPQQTAHRFPQFLPDGLHLLYYAVGTPGVGGVYVSRLDGSEPVRLLDADGAAVYAGGYLLFVRQGVLLAQSFDVQRLAVSGDVFPIAAGVNTSGTLLTAPLSASAAGPIIYRTGSVGGERQFVWFDRSGGELRKVGAPTPDVLSPAISADGRFVAVHRNIGGNGDIWILDLERGAFRRFASEPTSEFFPTWAPDGSRLVFSNRRDIVDGTLWQKETAGTGKEGPLLTLREAAWPNDWSADGRYLLFVVRSPKTRDDIWALPMQSDPRPFPIVQTGFSESNAQLSTDGKWLAYQSDETGRFEIYVQPFMGSGGKLQVSADGGAQVRWRRDGKELFYIALDGRLMVVPFRASASGDAGVPAPLFMTRLGGPLPQNSRQQYVVSADGQRFLMNTLVGDVASPITVILNWKAQP
jgi:hypothetical protein